MFKIEVPENLPVNFHDNDLQLTKWQVYKTPMYSQVELTFNLLPQDKTKQAVDNLHEKIVYVISSQIFNTLTEAQTQLEKWFDDGTLRNDCAVYEVYGCTESCYVISSSEFDTLGEAESQIVTWHSLGQLDPKARIYKSKVSGIYEVKPILTQAVIK